jgi:hypothetical protein
MKITTWRFAHDCLPCGHQLQKRHIPASSLCIFCGQHETVEHALLFCQFAGEVWKEIKTEFNVHLKRRGFVSARTWVLDFFNRCSDVEATVVMVVLWHIWDARNKAREGDTLVHPRTTAAKAKAYIEMILNNLYKTAPTYRCESSSSRAKWTPPPEGTVLINVDAAIFATSRRMGAGVVARNHDGSFLAACGERYDEVVVPEIAEAIAVRRALLFAQEEEFSKIIIASDCLSVIQRIKSGEVDRSLYGPVIEDIKLMSRGFGTCEFCHVYRVTNVAAHLLAKECESFESSVWRSVAPVCITDALCNDIMMTSTFCPCFATVYRAVNIGP